MTDIPPPICGYLGATVRADRITRPGRIRRQRAVAPESDFGFSGGQVPRSGYGRLWGAGGATRIISGRERCRLRLYEGRSNRGGTNVRLGVSQQATNPAYKGNWRNPMFRE